MRLKVAVFNALACSFIFSCGGESGGAPGSDMFGTVMLTTSIAKSQIDVDVVNPRVDNENKICFIEIPMNTQENQSVTFSLIKKPNTPQTSPSSPVYIYSSSLRITTTERNPEPLNRCILNNISHPSVSVVVPAEGSVSVDISVINQAMKDCIVNNYGSINPFCTVMQFDFGNQRSVYTVYAFLSFKAKELNTGIEKSFEISLGTFNLSDFVQQAAGGQQ